MVRTVNDHLREEEEDDEDFITRTTDGSSQKDTRRSRQRGSSHRSKHSETEQRRRSKINERFQILSDLIPQNDQKRDRASFLLEVIQYIQFLQEKLQIYEGTYQGWSPERTKLMPWRGNCGVDNSADQSEFMKNGSVDEENIVVPSALLTNAQNLGEPDFSSSAAVKAADHGAGRTTPFDVPLQQNMFENESTQTSQGSFPDVELLPCHYQPQQWNARSFLSDVAIPSCSPNVIEESKMQMEEDSLSNAYSKGLLNNITRTLGCCGVDLSQASISVQFDVRKGTSGASSTSLGTKDGEDCNPAQKKRRTEQSQ